MEDIEEQEDLEQTREEDQEWLEINEENIVFNEDLVLSKYNDLEEAKEQEEEGEEAKAIDSKEETKCLGLSSKFIGLIQSEESGFTKNAIKQWTKELIHMSLSHRESSFSFLSLQKKRLEVQKRLHKAYLRQRERQKKEQALNSSTEQKEFNSNVPVVVRLGVLSFFPLLESIRDIQGVNYSNLSIQILDILHNILITLPPLALYNEPADCLNAYQHFVFKIIEEGHFIIDTEDKMKAIINLIGLSILHGNASDLLLVVDTLFKLLKSSKNQITLRIGNYMRQLNDHKKNQDLSALFDKSFIGSFNISHTSVDNSSNSNNGISSDGSFIYSHRTGKGLQKIGTGQNHTIKGHVYSHVDYRTKDNQSSLACIESKIYYLIHEPQADASEGDLKGEDKNGTIKIAVLTSSNFQEEKNVVLHPKFLIGQKPILTSEGRYLYLVYCSKRKKTSKNENEPALDTFVVEIYDPLQNFSFLKSIELGQIIEVQEDSTKISKPSFAPNQWEKISIYVTGYQLCALLIANDGLIFTKTRIFSLIDGKHISDISMTNETSNLCACYDSRRNVIWALGENRIKVWTNLGIALLHKHQFSTNSYPALTPEATLSLISFSQVSELSPLEGILIILLNMDRLARQHAIYNNDIAQTNDSKSSDKEYCIDTQIKLFRLLFSILSETINTNDLPNETKAYIILSCLRILKVNTYQLSISKDNRQTDMIFVNIRTLLFGFIENPPLASVLEFASNLIKFEACYILTVGFTIFYQTPIDQRKILFSLLESANTNNLSVGKKLFLEILLFRLSEWTQVSNLLLEEDSMEIEEKAASNKEKGHTLDFLNALQDYAFNQSINSVKTNNFTDVAPLMSPTLHLLLLLQRDLISNPMFSHLFFDYVCSVFNQCGKLIESILASCKEEISVNLDSVLKSSLLGAILRSVAISLSRKRFVLDSKFVLKLLPHLMKLIKSLDTVNRLNPHISEADQQYLKRLNGKKETKHIVETRHPYMHGKNQMKQSVTIPGAKALSLTFDAKSRTSNNSDVLQLFQSPTMTAPILNSKDKKPLVFSGQNFPKQPIIIPGDSVTFVFSAGARADKNHDKRSRWGFKCKITELIPTDSYQPIFDYWLLDLQNLLALIGGRYASTLIEGETVTEEEKECLPWLDNKLLQGGLQEPNLIEQKIISEFIQGSDKIEHFYRWMEQQRGRLMLTPISKEPLKRVEKYVTTAILRHVSAMEEAKSFAQGLENKGSYSNDKFRAITKEIEKILISIQKQGQAENLWRAIMKENPNYETFNKQWKEEKKEVLMEMCELKGVNFDGRNEELTIENLYSKLHEDIVKTQTMTQQNPYEIVSIPIIERAELLLRLQPYESKIVSLNEQNFNRRIKELCKWLQGSKTWKHTPEGYKKTSTVPMPSFISISPTSKELEKFLKIHVLRARSRAEGLANFSQLLDIISFNSTKQQLLCTLGPPLNGGHYLSNITTCGVEPTSQVTNSFFQLFERITKILADKNSDTTSKQQALILCALDFRVFDVHILKKSQIFPLLQQLIKDCNLQIHQKCEEIKEEEKTENTEGNERKEYSETKQELNRLKNLSVSAWTAFRLLALNCMSWKIDSGENAIEEILELQDQIFELICAELRHISEEAIQVEEGSRCFELLSLLCLLGASTKGYKSLSKPENLSNLISILKTNSIEPRAKRLVLRLCRKLLPSQSLIDIPNLVSFFFNEIGNNILFDEKLAKQRANTLQNVGKGEQTTNEMEDEDFLEESDAEENEGEDEYSIFLHSWTLGHLRLLEICQNLGPDFFSPIVLDRQTYETKTQSILQEMTDEGKSLLKTMSLANCKQLASSIAALGGTISIERVRKVEEETSNRNRSRAHKSVNPIFWINGLACQSLCSELIYLVRLLLNEEKSKPHWISAIKTIICNSLGDLPSIFQGKASSEKFNLVLASLSILGGHTETVHIGGKVQESDSEEQKKAIVIDLHSDGSAEVIFDEEKDPKPRFVPATNLIPIPEININPLLFSSNPKLIDDLLWFIRNEYQTTLQEWLHFSIQKLVLKALNNLLLNSKAQNTFLQNTTARNAIPLLIKLASQCSANSRMSLLERNGVDLEIQLWDAVTKPLIPSSDSKVRTMADILPHFAFNHCAELLPTCFNPSKLQGFIFKDNFQKIEYIGQEPNPVPSLGRRSYPSRIPVVPTESVVIGNYFIPSTVPEYYFEITILQAESTSLVSIGLLPEGPRTWGNGSYRYQANAKKTTFVNGSRRQSDYGSHFRPKNVIGCGWNRDAKTIYFTKDGVNLGVAFTGVVLGKVYPAVGVSKGVQLSVNFGQEPFLYKLVIEGETEEEREKRKKEEEEQREKAKKEEEIRRKKEKEDERAANIVAAQPLVNMGFDLKMALVALRQTGFSGPEAASNWLVENMSSWNFDEEKDEETKEEEKEQDFADEKAKEKKDTLLESGEISDEKYATKSCQSFYLSDNFSYDISDTKKESFKVSSEWEDNVIPTIKAFMEKDGFSPFEVDEYLSQIRNQLSGGNDQQAKSMVLQILGDASCNIQFPSALSGTGSRSDKPPIKIDQVKIGMVVTVSKIIPPETKHWVSQMNSLVNCSGIVKAVDHQSDVVLVQFYNSEQASLSEWWISIKVLENPFPDKQSIFYSNLPQSSIKKTLAETAKQLSFTFARKIVLSLISRNSDIENTLPVKEILNLLSYEDISTPLFQFANHQIAPNHHLQAFQQNLLSLYDRGGGNMLTNLLIEEIVSLFDSCAKFQFQNTKFFTSSKSLDDIIHITIHGAQSLIVIFDRSIGLVSQSSLEFYQNEECTKMIRCYSDGSKFLPLIISHNELWFRLNCSTSQRGNCKFKFTVVPVHPKLSLVFWIVDFLLGVGVKYLSDVHEVCQTILNSALDYYYSTNIPSPLKESVLYMIGTLIQADKALQLERLKYLRDEMIELYEAEKKRENALHSSYLKSLISLMVEAKSNVEENQMDVEKTTEEPIKDDQDLHIAIALASSLRNNDNKSQDKKSEQETSKFDKKTELNQAVSLSMERSDSTQSDIPLDFQELEMNFEENEIDEEIKAAMALSLAQPKSEDKTEPPKSISKFTLSNLPWLEQLYEVKQTLNYFLSSGNGHPFFSKLATHSWQNSQKDHIKKRLLLVDNLPIVGSDRAPELYQIVQRTFEDITHIIHLFMPLEASTKKTKGYVIIEIANEHQIENVIKKMHRHKLKTPFPEEKIDTNLKKSNSGGASANLKKSTQGTSLKSSLRASSSNLRGTLKITRFTDVDEARNWEYLQSKLIRENQLTPECKEALIEIFNLFGGNETGILTAYQLNKLQLSSNGKPLLEEQIQYAFKTYKTKVVGGKTGLALEGFLDLYLKQCIEAPLDTWEELTKLGYDLHLQRNSFFDYEDAIRSLSEWTLNADMQLASYCEILHTEYELSSPSHLTLDQVKPISNKNAFPLLAKFSLPALRLRFEILRQFNSSLSTVLPLINFDKKHKGSVRQLLSSCRNLIFHAAKMEFIYQILDKVSIQGGQASVTIDRLKLASKKEKEDQDSLLQHTLFGIAFQQLRNAPSASFRQKKPGGTEPHFAIRIVFKNENVQGEGGPYRQFFTDISKELQGTLPLFVPCPNAQQGVGENREKWVIAPSCNTPNHLAMYEFLGRLMACALSTGVLMTMDLPSFFWKPLVGLPSETEDLRQIDHSIFSALRYFVNCSKEDLERECPHETMTTYLSDKTIVPLIEGGESVKLTFSNRDQYIKLVEETRLNESKVQMEAIRRGFGDVVPLQLLDLCTWEDIEWKVCGKPYIDIHLLKRHTMCSGISPDAPHITYFWNTLQSFNQHERRGFLRFVWAQERLPVSDEEFERSKIRMMIKPFPSTLSDPDSVFPKADTCFFNIMLPEYSSQKILREKLLMAIYTDSHSMNADEPEEDELSVTGSRGIQRFVSTSDDSSDSE